MTMICFRRYASVNYLVAALPKSSPVPTPVPKPSRVSVPTNVPSTKVSQYIYTSSDLSKYFRDDSYGHPLPVQLSRANTIFHNASIKHEWTCAKYHDIPDVKVDRLTNERKQQLASLDPYRRTEYHDNLERSRTSFGIDPQLLHPLPEVLLIGHTNAGKSTLINSILLNKQQARTGNTSTEYAYVSKKAGYTQCLNCYNVGNKLRIIDSPGYGQFGKEAQGQVVLDYIQRRKQLRRTFVVIDSLHGIREEDAVLVEYLIDHGALFELVFTKVDILMQKHFPKINMAPEKHDYAARIQAFEHAKEGNSNVLEHIQKMISAAGLRDLATLPRLIFNNSHTSKLLPNRYGFRDVRFAIAESCSLVESPVQIQEVVPQIVRKGQKATRRPRPTAKI